MQSNTVGTGYPNSKALSTAGRVVRTLASIHPRVASVVVNRLFFMTFSKPPTAAEQRALSNSERLSLPFRGRELAAYAWGTGPTVILLHGWSSNAGSMHHFVVPLLEAGFRVFAFDAPAHGASPGRMTDAVEYGEAIRAAIEMNNPVEGVIAHSFGAMAMLLLLAEEPGLAIKAVVANNPPAELSTLIDIFAERLELPESVLNGLRRNIHSRFGRPVEYFSLKSHIRSVTGSGMIIADRNDALARFEDTQYLASQWPGARGPLVCHGRVRPQPTRVERAGPSFAPGSVKC